MKAELVKERGSHDLAGVPVAELVGVTRYYEMGGNVVRALDDFTFTFGRGEYWAVMGSSGSGKSTLLNLLGCIDHPNSGVLKIDGETVYKHVEAESPFGANGHGGNILEERMTDDELSELRSRKLGFVFQSYNLIPQLNVLENIMVPLFYQDDPPPDGEERARALAERVGLGQRLEHRPTELSGGQQQRVAIARALVNHPALILADEATGNLDSATALEILALLDELHAEGRTIVLVTHEPDVGERAEHVLRLKDGRIESVRRGRARPEAGA